MDHVAISIRDQERSRRFYERDFWLRRPAGAALALGPGVEQIARPSWMHFWIGLPDRDAVLAPAFPARR